MVLVVKFVLICVVIVVRFVGLVEVRVHRRVAPIPSLVVETHTEVKH